MAGPNPRLWPVARLAVVLGLVLGSVAAPAASPAHAAGLAPWTGSIDLYRDGVFTTQKSWLWCTAADVQIARNIVTGAEDHRASSQRRYFDWMRARNHYDLPLSAGVDPAGWTAGLRHFVDDRYRLVASTSFDSAIRLAVTRLRLTNLPVALAVSHGNHGWLLTGFAATADPAATKDFTITSVRVTGPLYGLQSRNGYDMPPDTKLTLARLRGFFTPWRYDPLPMIWDGRYVSIQPVPAGSAAAPSAPTIAPSPIPSPSPSPRLSPSPFPSPSPARSAGPIAAFPASPIGSVGPSLRATTVVVPTTAPADEPRNGLWLAALTGALAVATVAWLARRRLRRS